MYFIPSAHFVFNLEGQNSVAPEFDCSSQFILALCGWDGPCGPLVRGVPWQGK